MNSAQLFAIDLRADDLGGEVVKSKGRYAIVWQADNKWHALLVDDVDAMGRVWWSGSATTAKTRTEAIQALS